MVYNSDGEPFGDRVPKLQPKSTYFPVKYQHGILSSNLLLPVLPIFQLYWPPEAVERRRANSDSRCSFSPGSLCRGKMVGPAGGPPEILQFCHDFLLFPQFLTANKALL
ncbi:hypothetical protein GDO81_010088 [Engystomops pustulosus]|uniref:Uncharacterized protein n=1 Tax=Engystomops pustulosus TaxID=76066 RepID=A0AAV7BY06_ENGPU|nr:hypothetical protein GDO81_010088 [Engystomops pustulosus]